MVVIGGGPAGLGAALRLREQGVEDILILERENAPGGILRQCIHDGFGLTRFGETLSGPEYAQRFVDRVAEAGIPCVTGCTVLDLTADKVITAARAGEIRQYQARAVVLADCAARYLREGSLPPCPLEVKAGPGVGHVIPQYVSGKRDLTLSLRVRAPMRDVTLTVTQNARAVLSRKLRRALPAEMLQLPIRGDKLDQSGDLEVNVG